MADSTYWRILSALGTRVGTVATAPVPQLRQKLLALQGDTYPLLIVAPGANGEKYQGGTFGGGAFWAYPVTVAYVTAGNRTVATGLQAYLNLREAIRDVLFQPTLAGVASLVGVDINPQAVVDLQAYLTGNYDVTGWELTFESVETRTS